MKICHITSVHQPEDIRIFQKQCSSLNNSGHKVTLVATGERSQFINGIYVKAFKKRGSALKRLILTLPRILFYLVKNKFDIYHAHDPELLPVLLVLHFLRRKVVYDMHENFPKEIQRKELPTIIKRAVSVIWPLVEKITFSRINVIFAELSYKKDYPYITNSVDILNMPLLDILKKNKKNKKNNVFSIGYVGVVSPSRFCLEILEVLYLLKKKGIVIRFDCIGPISDKKTQIQIEKYCEILDEVYFYGQLPARESWKIISHCHVGLAVLEDDPNYIESLPTKIFEYLAMNIPVISSNFPLYKSITEDLSVGICVKPIKNGGLEEAILEMKDNKTLYNDFIMNIRNKVEGNFSWDTEFDKLEKFYKAIVT